jgi:hypothetical protein
VSEPKDQPAPASAFVRDSLIMHRHGDLHSKMVDCIEVANSLFTSTVDSDPAVVRDTLIRGLKQLRGWSCESGGFQKAASRRLAGSVPISRLIGGEMQNANGGRVA